MCIRCDGLALSLHFKSVYIRAYSGLLTENGSTILTYEQMEATSCAPELVEPKVTAINVSNLAPYPINAPSY